jgi:hypothetical protein
VRRSSLLPNQSIPPTNNGLILFKVLLLCAKKGIPLRPWLFTAVESEKSYGELNELGN